MAVVFERSLRDSTPRRADARRSPSARTARAIRTLRLTPVGRDRAQAVGTRSSAFFGSSIDPIVVEVAARKVLEGLGDAADLAFEGFAAWLFVFSSLNWMAYRRAQMHREKDEDDDSAAP